MQKKDIEGKTLAELRQMNAQLDKEQAIENNALRTEYLTMQAKFHSRKEMEELQADTEFEEVRRKYYADLDELDFAYKEQGMTIGKLMDLRNNANDETLLKIRQQIDACMDKRRDLKRARRERAAKFREEFFAVKKKFVEINRKCSNEWQDEEQALRKRRVEAKTRITDLRDLIREEIEKRLAEGRAKAE